MDARFELKLKQVQTTYPGMSPHKQQVLAAKLLSEDLGPFWRVVEDGTVERNKAWRGSLNPYERYVYDGIVQAYGKENNRTLHPFAEHDVEVYRKLVRNNTMSSAHYRVWQEREYLKAVRGEALTPWEEYLAHKMVSDANERTNRSGRGRPTIDPVKATADFDNRYSYGAFNVEINPEVYKTMEELLRKDNEIRMKEALERHAEKVRRGEGFHPTGSTGWQRSSSSKPNFEEVVKAEYHEDGEIVYPSLGPAFDLAVQQKQTIVVWLREKRGVTKWRVCPNNVASEVLTDVS